MPDIFKSTLVRREAEAGINEGATGPGTPMKTDADPPPNKFFKPRERSPAIQAAKQAALVKKMRERGDFQGSSFGAD